MEIPLLDKMLLRSIGQKLLERKQTIAVAESVTSGLLQFAFSNMEDASKFYHGGITAYNIGQKFKHLNVEAIHALAVNCVSQKIADEMSLNVAALFNSDWGIGITGYASPAPESDNTIFAYYSVSFRQAIQLSGIVYAEPMEPVQAQVKYVNVVLERLAELTGSMKWPAQ